MVEIEAGKNEPHSERARRFVEVVNDEIAKKFPGLSIQATNLTVEDLGLAPYDAQEAWALADPDLMRSVHQDNKEITEESKRLTRVGVGITGDDSKLFNTAGNLIDKTATKLRGVITNDTGIQRSRLNEGLDAVLGHNPKHEDAPYLRQDKNFKFM